MAELTCCEKFWDTMGVGCCIDEDSFKKAPLAEVTQNKDRHCTDVPCIFVLLLVILAQVYLVIHAERKGADPEYLLRGWDYKGNLCKKGYSDGEYNAWVDVKTSYKVRICVHDCSATQTDPKIITKYESKKCMCSIFKIRNKLVIIWHACVI